MFTSTVVLAGTVVIEGVAFRWSVTDGVAQQLTVSHPAIGTHTQKLTASPHAQARAVGRAMLNSTLGVAAIGYIDADEDVASLADDPDPPTIE
jgi:hypothetical protein